MVQAKKLAMADRNEYVGDPDYIDNPLDELISKPWAAQRRTLMNPAADINFEPGPHNSKLWGLATLPNEAGQARQGVLPTLPAPCPAGSEESARPCLPSIKEGRQRAAAPAGQPEADMTPEPAPLATEFDHELFSRSEAV